MVVACVLSDLVSWFSCTEATVPFTETISLIVFFVAFLTLKVYPLRESLPPSLFIASIVAIAFYALGVINVLAPITGIVLTALSVVFLSNQTSSPY